MMWFANAVAWFATSVAVIGGMYLTKSAWCLWAFFIPALMMADYAKIYMSILRNIKQDKTLHSFEKSTCTQNGGSAKLKLIAPVKLYKLLFIVNQ